MSRQPSPRRSYGNVGPAAPREENQTALPPSPPVNAYRPGFCANGTSACCGDVAPTQLELGGPRFPICLRCNTEAAEYRSAEVRGYDVDEDEYGGDFRKAVTKAFNATVHREVRGPKWFYAPRHRGEGVR